MEKITTPFTRLAGIEYPVICGAMYPCSNPELIAAVSEAGGLGIIQPVTLSFVFNMKLKEGIRKIRELTAKPVGFNAIVEKTSKLYEKQMMEWVDLALSEGVRFFITALGNPSWVVEKVHSAKGMVFHDVTEKKWAEKALAAGVDGLICVNNQAGGHLGNRSSEELIKELSSLKVPLIAAGGIGNGRQVKEMLASGYCGVQLGTRFIASEECSVNENYKKAIISAKAKDIVQTEKSSGVPVSVINNDYIKKLGTKAGPVGKYLLQHERFKRWMRTFYYLKSFKSIKNSSQRGDFYKNIYQAGKSCEYIDEILPVKKIMDELM